MATATSIASGARNLINRCPFAILEAPFNFIGPPIEAMPAFVHNGHRPGDVAVAIGASFVCRG
jgi:hypothetical protein